MSRLLILAEGPGVGLRDPLDQARPALLLRNGAWTIAQRWRLLLMPDQVRVGVRPWLKVLVAEQTGWQVNSPADGAFDDVWIVIGCATAAGESDPATWATRLAWSDASDMVIRLDGSQWRDRKGAINEWLSSGGLEHAPIEGLDSAGDGLFVGASGLWDIVNRLPAQLAIDATMWRAAGKKAGYVERHELSALINEHDILFGDGVSLAAHTVLDASTGPIILDDHVTLEPFTRIDGPAYVGTHTRVAGGKITGGCAIGPGCRIGGELEASIIQGFTNKVHEGFFGHGFLGEWVNLGALTTNSDLKNTYGTVRVNRSGRPMDTGCLKVGSYLSDHTKMGIGTLLPTGATMGVGVNCAVGGLTDGHIPPFIWNTGAGVAEHDIERMLKSAAIAIERRGRDRRSQNLSPTMTEAEKSVLRHLFDGSHDERQQYIAVSRAASGVGQSHLRRGGEY